MKQNCCRKADAFQGRKLGFCLTLGNGLSKEAHVLTKQEILLGKGTWVESSRVREPRRTALWHGLQSLFGFYGDGISFQVILSHLFWLKVIPDGASLVQPRWMPEWRILGGGRTCGVSFWPFLKSSSWWLVNSMFLTRTSCKWLLWCSSRVGGFSQCASPNTFMANRWGNNDRLYFWGLQNRCRWWLQPWN